LVRKLISRLGEGEIRNAREPPSTGCRKRRINNLPDYVITKGDRHATDGAIFQAF
jgi:hypothetical protein